MWLLMLTLYNLHTGEMIGQAPYVTFTEDDCYALGEAATEEIMTADVDYICVQAPVLTAQEQTSV